MRPKKYTLRVMSNRTQGGGVHELEAERVICNDIIFPWEYRPHNMRLWCIGCEFGALGAVWADCEQDALDELIDQNLGQALLIPEEDVARATDDDRQEWSHFGNAGEPCNLDNVWMASVEFNKERDFDLLMALAEARGANVNNLDKL